MSEKRQLLFVVELLVAVFVISHLAINWPEERLDGMFRIMLFGAVMYWMGITVAWTGTKSKDKEEA